MKNAAALAMSLPLLAGCLATYPHRELVRRAPGSPDGVLFHDFRVFPATDERALEHQDVLVRGDRIVSVSPTGGPVPERVQVIEGGDQTLLPGLIDFHAHLTGTAAPPWKLTWPDPDHIGQSYLYCGVTTVYDVAGDLDDLVKLRERETRGEWLGPHFTYAGQMVTADRGYPASMVRDLLPWPVSAIAVGHFATEVRDAAEAEGAVARRQELGADHVKVAVAQIPLNGTVFEPKLLESVVASAHRRGMKVAAHIDTQEHALLAARSGVDVLVHGVQLGPLSQEAAAELAARKVSVALTLVAFDRMERLKTLQYAPTAIEQQLNPKDELDAFSPEQVKSHTISKGMDEWIAELQGSHTERLQNVQRLMEAGVNIVAGSDGEGSAATWAGGAYLEELTLMSQAGIPNAQVLLAATSRPAKLIAAAPDFGTVEPGKRADLLLVHGNPLDDVDFGTRISGVMRSGALLERLRPAPYNPRN
jgi:imidazolonepropionase-like amidohydrolase